MTEALNTEGKNLDQNLNPEATELYLKVSTTVGWEHFEEAENKLSSVKHSMTGTL